LIHGGGGTAEGGWAAEWAARGYATLAIDLYGQGPGRQRLPDGGPDWSDDFASFRLDRGIVNTWIYHGIANCLRAISVLAVLPGVDADRLGVLGVSWGGYFCSSVMCLHERVKVGIPTYCAGFNPRVAKADFIDGAAGQTLRDTFDPSNVFDRCRAAVLWTSSATDRGATLEELVRSHHAIRDHAPSRLCVHAGPGHTDPRGLGSGEQPTPRLFTDSIFRGAPALGLLDAPALDGTRLTLAYRGELPIDVAGLHWTTDLDKPWTDRTWHATWADISAPGVITADLPSARPLQAFFTTVDARGALVSSEPVDLGQ